MRRVLVMVVLAAALAGCGTPPEVKTLSTAQVGYLKQASDAVMLQSEALLLAAGKVKADAEARIDALTQQRGDNFKAWLKSSPADADTVIDKAMAVGTTATASKETLAARYAEIEASAAALKQTMAKLQEVQQVLDAYLHSEQLGESVMRDLFGSATVQGLLAKAGGLVSDTVDIAGKLRTQNTALTAQGENA